MGQEHLSLMATILAEKGLTRVVVSPGSRNAPAIIAFNQTGRLQLWSIPDERSAGFFALGMSLQLQEPIALLCTSGTAALNYAPAIAEAYYQKLPLLVITADRPAEWIDQGDGQTIRQQQIFQNYIRKSFHLPHEISTPSLYWHFTRTINEAVDRTRYPAPGPVHLNLPLQEPLYDIKPYTSPKKLSINRLTPVEHQLSKETLQELAERWNRASSKLVLIGQLPPDSGLEASLRQLAGDPSVALMTETISNLNLPGSILCIDRAIEGLSGENTDGLRPEILLTLGGAVVSKKIKALLGSMGLAQHWHINPDPDDFHIDTYQSLTDTIPMAPASFLQQLAPRVRAVESSYGGQWQQRAQLHQEKHLEFLTGATFSDMKVFETLFQTIPKDHLLHLANSTPVRYSQLFREASGYTTFSNRGTSGIDGCLSTAVGAASVARRPVTVITGDIGFFYDSNALWNTVLPSNLRVVLINNAGGNIFRFIPGPDRFSELEPFIEVSHRFRAEGIARSFDVNYYTAANLDDLRQVLPAFLASQDNNRPALLEIHTPSKISAQVLKDYFKYIRS